MAQRPIAIGLLVCDQVIIEEKTGNITPVNCFTHRIVDRFPSAFSPFAVLAFLTEGSGDINIELEIHRLDTFEMVYRKGSTYLFSNPLNQVRCLVRIRDFSFPEAGQYQVAILANQEMVAQRKITITKEKT